MAYAAALISLVRILPPPPRIHAWLMCLNSDIIYHVLQFYQPPTFQTINAASSNNSLTSRKICELGEIMEGVDRSLGWMKRSYDEMISTTCQETQASHQQIITRADTPEHPHVHAIIDARCKCDIAVIECKKERETKLKEIYNVSTFSRFNALPQKSRRKG